MERIKKLLKKHWRDPRDKKDNSFYNLRKKARLKIRDRSFIRGGWAGANGEVVIAFLCT